MVVSLTSSDAEAFLSEETSQGGMRYTIQEHHSGRPDPCLAPALIHLWTQTPHMLVLAGC